MKRMFAAAVTGVFLAAAVPGTIWATGIEKPSSGVHEKTDVKGSEYLKDKGDALKDKLNNVMEPVKNLEGIRGTTGDIK